MVWVNIIGLNCGMGCGISLGLVLGLGVTMVATINTMVILYIL
jgi:hypothetical protein